MFRRSIALKFIFVLFLSHNLSAQLKVVDSLTKLPMGSVTISIDGNAVQITNEQGVLDVEKLNLKQGQSVAFSSIGYQQKVILYQKLLALDTVFLHPVTYALNEVNISTKRYRNHLVGGAMSILYGSNFNGGYSFEEARFFPNEYKNGSKIIAVQYFVIRKQSFQKQTKVDLSNAFGVGVYEANADGSPGKPILLDALVVVAKEHATWFEVNLAQYNLAVPKYGFVVSFKVLPAAFYGKKDMFVKEADFVAPVLAIKTYLKKSTNINFKAIERLNIGI